MKEDMVVDSIRIKYSSKYAQCANYWKYFIGQTKGLKRLKVFDKKKEIEDNFVKWINETPERKDKYKDVLPNIAAAYKEYADKKYDERMWYFQELLTGAEALYFVYQVQGLESVISQKEIKKTDLEPFKEIAKNFFKDYNQPTDKKIFVALMKMYKEDLPEQFLPDVFQTINKKYKGSIDKYADELYNKSIFTSSKAFNKFLEKPSLKVFKNDLCALASNSFIQSYIKMNSEKSDMQTKLKLANRLFIDGLRQMIPNRKYYPDANSTMRMTYGQILDYYPADAVHYDYQTTLAGIMEKEDPKNDEFIVPAKLKELYQKKDYGRYGENGNLPVCFIGNLDITGGNSGSPVINADGQLIGIAFDGNWEAMSGDIAYEPALQRTICVDIRYVLFIIDKYAGAKHLVDEMKLVQ